MGRIIQQNNGKTTVLVTGENISSITPEANTYVLGVDLTSGLYEKLNPDGSILDLEGGGGSSSVNMYNITYSGLVTNINNSTLSGGSFYMISDFATIYDQPDFYIDGNAKGAGFINTYTGSTEPIIVLATSENTISIDAYQPTYPKDKIKYDWSWSNTEINSIPTYGRVSERIDEYENRTDYDHRTINFLRYQSYETGTTLTGTINEYDCNTGVMLGNGTAFSGELTTGSTIVLNSKNDIGYQVGVKVVNIIDDTTMDVVVDSGYTSTVFTVGNGYDFTFYTLNGTGSYTSYKEIYIGQRNEGDYSEFATFILDGGSLSNYIGDYSVFYLNGIQSGFLLANNIFGSNSYSNTIGDNYYSNTIGNNYYSNTIGDYFQSNTIGDYFQSNTITNNFGYNKIGSYFNNNTIGSDFGYGGSQAQGNVIGDGFEYNTIGQYCYNNIIGNYFNNNIIGIEFEDNQIQNYFIGNTIGIDFNNNSIGNIFTNNVILDDFNRNNIDYEFNANTVYNQFNNNKIKTAINTVDFTSYYNGITAFASTATGSTATDGIYIGLTQNSTTGIGLNATFDIEVSGGTVIGVTGNTQGELYEISDTLTILGTQIIGTDGVDDVVITVTGISQLPSVYETYTCDIFERQGGVKRLSYYDSSDMIQIKNINQ